MPSLLTAAQLRAIMPAAPAERWAPALAAAMARWRILSVPARAAFLAVCGEESGYFTAGRERLNYSAQGLAATFKRFRLRGADGAAVKDADGRPVPTPEAAALAAAGERAIANAVYANPAMGNVEPDDGWSFRGGCPIQITFHDTWRDCALAHGLVDPDRSELAGWADEASNDPALAASCSAWFWTTYKPQIMPLADTGREDDFLRACRHVGVPPSQRVTDLWLSLWRRGREVLGAGEGGSDA